MDYAALSASLIAHVRGTMSQEHLSRRLGFASNVLYLWERQRRLPNVGTFLRMADVRRWPYRDGLRDFAGPGAVPREGTRRVTGEPIDLPALLRSFAGDHTLLELARVTGFDRATLARWLAGKTEPRLPDFLEYLEKSTLRLLDFVALFVHPGELEVTRTAYEEHRKRQRLAYEQPWSNAVLHALELSRYRAQPRHRPSVLAERLGLSVDEVEAHLERLHDARLIEKREGRWCPARVLSVDTRSDFEANRALKRHWARVSAERLERYQPEHQSLFSYNVFALAQADLVRLRELHLEYYQRVRTLVANASGADHVVVMNVQLCALDEGST
jgi:transcriptional regulator with XRE-family HTH domain